MLFYRKSGKKAVKSGVFLKKRLDSYRFFMLRSSKILEDKMKNLKHFNTTRSTYSSGNYSSFWLDDDFDFDFE